MWRQFIRFKRLRLSVVGRDLVTGHVQRQTVGLAARTAHLTRSQKQPMRQPDSLHNGAQALVWTAQCSRHGSSGGLLLCQECGLPVQGPFCSCGQIQPAHDVSYFELLQLSVLGILVLLLTCAAGLRNLLWMRLYLPSALNPCSGSCILTSSRCGLR